MVERHPTGLEQRLADLGEAMFTLATAVDENLRTVLLAMTTEEVITPSIGLVHTTPFQEVVTKRALTLLALEGPVARDLRWAMGMMRLSKDYERVADLTKSLMKRVVVLSDSLHQDTLHAMTDVMRAILRLHGVLLEPARPHFMIEAFDWDAHASAVSDIARGIEAIEQRSVEALMRGEGSPENLRELVLATRHILRIGDQIERMPQEFARFRGI